MATFPNFIANPAAINASGFSDATWNTGIASGAPAGATGMAVLLVGGSGATVARELRKTGSTDSYTADTMPQQQQVVRFVGLNSSGQFDYYSGSHASSDLIYPLVYFGPEATFPTNQPAMASTLTTSYATYGTGGNAPSATAAVFAIHGGSDYASWFRQPADTTDNLSNVNEGGGGARRDFFTILDGTQEYNAKAGTAGRQPYLVCYFTSCVTSSGNPVVSRTPGTAGSYQNLATTGDTSPVGIMYYLNSPSTSYTYQLSEQGSTWTAPTLVPSGNKAGYALAPAPAQINIQNTALTVNEIAYFTAGTSITAVQQQLASMGVGS